MSGGRHFLCLSWVPPHLEGGWALSMWRVGREGLPGPLLPCAGHSTRLEEHRDSLEKQPLARGHRESGCSCMKSDGPFYFPCPVVVWGNPAGTSSGLRSVFALWVLTAPPGHSGVVVFISKLFKNSLPEYGQAPLPLPRVALCSQTAGLSPLPAPSLSP